MHGFMNVAVINVIINMVIQLTGFNCVIERRCPIPRLNKVGGSKISEYGALVEFH